MAEFRGALDHTLEIEGGYSYDPQDPGGETIKGVSRKNHPNWEGWKIVDEAKSKPCFPQCALANVELNSLVALFYKKKFWDVFKLDALVNQAVANEMFDAAVNVGYKRVGKWFQESLNLLNRGGKDYSDITVDGAVGNMSLEAFKLFMNTSRFSSRNTQKNERVFLKVLNYYQMDRYVDITEANETLEKYFFGWVDNRIS